MDMWLGPGTWRSPRFLGNSGRSPITPHITTPYKTEIKALDEWRAFERVLDQELFTTHRILQFCGAVNPQRETCDYALVNDALYLQDLEKALEEQRHEMAIDCVNKGIYKDVIEAKN